MPQSKAKNILITGARGIGRVLARHFLLSEADHRLYILDIDAEELKHTIEVHLPAVLAAKVGAESPAAPEEDLSARVGYALCDMRDPGAVRDTVRKAADFFGGRIDVLVNNAGIARAAWPDGKTMEDPSTLEPWIAYMETNLTGPFVMSQACIPFMKADPARYLHGRGHNGSVQAVLDDPARQQNLKAPQGDAGACIINISSFRARQSQPNCEGYAASKAGLLGLTHAIAVSGAQWGIRCNAILPGYINVKHECKSGDEEGQPWAHNVKEERHLQHLVGRIGCGDDIAMTVEWLMNAGFVSGEEIVVDGGVSKIKHQAA